MSRQYISICILTALLLPLGACTAFKDVDAVIKQDPAANNNASNNTPVNNNPVNNNPVNNNPVNNNPVNNNPVNNNPVNNNPVNNNPVNNNPVCTPTCATEEEGDRRCAGGAIERCDEDAQGCLMWQVEETCGANQVCEDEDDDVACECVNGEMCPELDATCLDATTRQVCNVDADGCAVFEGDACDPGAACDLGNGACVQLCEDDSMCPDGIVGDGRCLNGTCYAPCGADGTCADGEVCADGVCVAVCDDDMPLCRTQETCVEPAGSEIAYCEPSCEPHADHDPNGAGASRDEALDLADGQVIEVRTCREDGVWLRVPGRVAGDRLDLSFISGANLDILEVEVIEAAPDLRAPLRPGGPGETLSWDVGFDGDVFLHLIFADVPTDAFWIDVELGLEIVSGCDGAEPLILNEPRALTTAMPLSLNRLICPMQEVWVQTEVIDRAQLIFRGTAQGDLQVALGQEPLLPIWESEIAQEERTLQVRRLEAGPLYVRFHNPTRSPIRVESSLTLATSDACSDSYSNNQSPVDAPWISRGTTRAVVCDGRPDIFKIAPPPGADGSVAWNVRLSANNLTLEWSTNPAENGRWTTIPTPTNSPGYNLASLRTTGGEWGDQPLYLRVTRQGGTTPNITYDLYLTSTLGPPQGEMDDLNMGTEEQPFQLIGRVQGHLSDLKPTDYFTWTPTSDELVGFQVETPDSVLAGVRVEVDDANGRPITRRLVGGEATRVVFPTTAPGPYQVRLSAAQRDSMGLLMHYSITPEPALNCNDEELLPAGGVSRAWAELGQTHIPRGRPTATLCPQEQSRMELDLQGLNEVNAILHKLNAEPRRLAWSLEGPGCGVNDRTVWVGSTSQATDVSVGARCGPGEDALLAAGTYTLRLGNPDGEALFLNASAVERRDLNNPAGPCPEVFEGPDDPFNDRLFSAEVAPAGQLLIPGSPVSGSLGFCGEYGDSVDTYAIYAPTSNTSMPIHLAWIGEPEGTPLEWTLSDANGVHVTDSRDDTSNPADGPTRYVTLEQQGWYTLRVELPGWYVSTDTTASAWYSVSVGQVWESPPPACSGTDMMTEYDHDDFLMQFNNPSMLLYSPNITLGGSSSVQGNACAFDLDMAHVKVPPNHDVRAILTPMGGGSAPLMGLDAYQMRGPESLENPVDFDFTQEYDDAIGDYYVPAVVYWHESTPMNQPGHLLRAYTVGASNAPYTLDIADLDCADPANMTPTEPASPSQLVGNNVSSGARPLLSGADQPLTGTLCSAGRDDVDWLKYTHGGGTAMTFMAKLRFENLPGVRGLSFQVYADPSQPPATSPLLPCSAQGACLSGQECCIQTPVTVAPGQSFYLEVRRTAAGQGESAGLRYSMTLE